MTEEFTDMMSTFMTLYYGGLALAAIILAILCILSAIGMSKRKWLMFSLIMAGIQCILFPFVTVLGVFTFIILLRPSVTLDYQKNKPLTH